MGWLAQAEGTSRCNCVNAYLSVWRFAAGEPDRRSGHRADRERLCPEYVRAGRLRFDPYARRSIRGWTIQLARVAQALSRDGVLVADWEVAGEEWEAGVGAVFSVGYE